MTILRQRPSFPQDIVERDFQRVNISRRCYPQWSTIQVREKVHKFLLLVYGSQLEKILSTLLGFLHWQVLPNRDNIHLVREIMAQYVSSMSYRLAKLKLLLKKFNLSWVPKRNEQQLESLINCVLAALNIIAWKLETWTQIFSSAEGEGARIELYHLHSRLHWQIDASSSSQHLFSQAPEEVHQYLWQKVWERGHSPDEHH